MPTQFQLDVRWTVSFLCDLLDAAGDGTSLSLEGDLSKLDSRVRAIASTIETDALRRSTLDPTAEFVVVRLSPAVVPMLKSALRRIGLRRRVHHVQLEMNGLLVFGAYDQFEARGAWVHTIVTEDWLRERWARGQLRGPARVSAD